MTVPNTCPTDPLAVPWNSGWEIPCGVRSPTLPAAGAASLQIPRRAMTPPQIPSKTSRQIERQVVYEKSRSGQSVGHGKRHVPVLDPEPSWKVGRFTGPDRPHRVGLAPTVGFRFMSYCRNSSRIVAALRASIARNTRAISATRREEGGEFPALLKATESAMPVVATAQLVVASSRVRQTSLRSSRLDTDGRVCPVRPR